MADQENFREIPDTHAMIPPLLSNRRHLKYAASAALLMLGLGCARLSAAVAPQLTSISLTSASSVTAGSAISWSYTVTPGTDPNIEEVAIYLLDPNGHEVSFLAIDQASGSLGGSSTQYWVNGAYAMSQIIVIDNSGHQTTYAPNGTITYSAGATGPSTTSLPFSTIGFTITGGASANTAPQLASISLASPATITAGNSVSYDFSITPGTDPGIKYFSVTLVDPHGNQIPVEMQNSASGTLTVASSTSWADGNYTVANIQVEDNSDYLTEYHPDGTITYPNGGTGPSSTSSFPFSALSFSLAGGMLPINGDINGDDKADIFWMNTSTGVCGAYLMNGTSVAGWAGLGTVATQWRIAAVADFTGDGQNDILWQNTSTGECGFYIMNGTTVTGWTELGTFPTAWRIAGAADFEGNGNNDILWQNTSTGECGFYLMNGTTVTGWAELGTVPTQWNIKAAADFNNDGKPDILWQNSSNGQVGIYLMNGTAVTGWSSLGTAPAGWQAVGAGYFSGNGNNDIIWQNTSTGECGLYLMNGTTVSGWSEIGIPPAEWQIQY
jgi:serralysin